jgi:hypothetical protein
VRTWLIIFAVLLLILAVDAAASRKLEETAARLSELTSALTDAVERENWAEASSLQDELDAYWDETRPRLQMFIDHAELENVDILMARIRAMLPARDTGALLPELSELSRDISHLTRRYELAAENVF